MLEPDFIRVRPKGWDPLTHIRNDPADGFLDRVNKPLKFKL
jgi:hypothetical protein